MTVCKLCGEENVSCDHIGGIHPTLCHSCPICTAVLHVEPPTPPWADWEPPTKRK